MDISSSTATASTAAAAATTENTQASSAQKTAQSDKSFKEELQKASKETTASKDAETEKSAENKTENKVTDKTEQNDKKNQDASIDLNQSLILSGEINMTAFGNQNLLSLNNKPVANNFQNLIDTNLRLTTATLADNDNAPVKVDYSIMQIGDDDAKFFADLVKNTDKTLQNVSADLQSGMEQTIQQVHKNVKVSATLMNALSEAVKTNQPFRIDFDKDVSVIIKVDKDGALSARFIPGDKAVEEYLKQNLSFLKQRFDEQELSYKDLSYSQQRQQQENNRRNNKENNHE